MTKKFEGLTIGITVKFTPIAAAHWREYRNGTLIETGEDVVVEFEDGTKRTVPAEDVVVGETEELKPFSEVVKTPKTWVVAEDGETTPGVAVGKMVVGDDAGKLSGDVVESEK